MSTKCVLVYMPYLGDWGLAKHDWEVGKEINLPEKVTVKTRISTDPAQKGKIIPLFQLTVKENQIDADTVKRILKNSDLEIKTALAGWLSKLEDRIKKLEQRNEVQDKIESIKKKVGEEKAREQATCGGFIPPSKQIS